MHTLEHFQAVADYNLVVVAATVAYPQSSPGTVMTAGEAMRHIRADYYTGQEFSATPITEYPDIFAGMKVVTRGAHLMAGRPTSTDSEAPKVDLNAATLFSDEIIKAATRVAVDTYADGEVRDTLYLPTPEDHVRFHDLTADRVTARKLERIFNFGTRVAFAPGGEALALGKKFQRDLKANSAAHLYEGLPYADYSDRKRKLQQGIGVAVNNLVLRELDATPRALSGIKREHARAALTSLFAAMPDPSFPRHYFKPPVKSERAENTIHEYPRRTI